MLTSTLTTELFGSQTRGAHRKDVLDSRNTYRTIQVVEFRQ